MRSFFSRLNSLPEPHSVFARIRFTTLAAPQIHLYKDRPKFNPVSWRKAAFIDLHHPARSTVSQRNQACHLGLFHTKSVIFMNNPLLSSGCDAQTKDHYTMQKIPTCVRQGLPPGRVGCGMSAMSLRRRFSASSYRKLISRRSLI